MKMRAGLLVTCAASALAIGLGFASPVLAADTMPIKAPVVVAPAWWYEGFAEIGGRFFLNNPDRRDLGKFYEYRDLRPGVYGNFFFGAHRAGPDPLDIEAWGKNVGWNDQAYGLDIANPGTYYLTFGWDETPHVWSQKAQTLYSGVGGNVLTVPDAVRTNLRNSIAAGLPTAASNAIINANSHEIDLKIRRDTASAAARWTPTDNWDFTGDYSHMHREGVQALGAVSFSPAASGTSATRSTFEIPKPVDDVTQNARIKGEYAGTTPWSTPFNIAVGGGFSDYSNSFNSVIFQNPWNAVNSGLRPQNNQYSLPPDNQAGSVNVQGGVGLPFNSRYMGTFQYTNMRAGASGLPISINPLLVAALDPGFSAITPNRETNTLLFNNVLNTRITNDLTSSLKYRYYDYRPDDTPASLNNYPANPDSTLNNPDDEFDHRHPTGYTKQNFDAQLVWKVVKWLNVGASYDWEHWNRTNRSVVNTDENIAKVFADSKWGFSNLRASLQFSERRNDGYNDLLGNPTQNNAAFRMKDLANRDRTKGQFSWAVDVIKELTITPNGGFLYDDYQTDICFTAPGCEIGIKKAESWNAGADATLTFNRMAALFFSYNYERGYRQVFENSPVPLLNIETADQNHTFIVGGKFTIIPSTLFLDVNYAHTFSDSAWNLSCTPAGCQYSPLAIFPDTHNTNDRVDVQAKYVFDETVTRGWGLWPKSQAYVKARVLWERNTNDAWQPLQVQSGWLINPGNATTAYSVWMATGNPNYNVVLGQLAFGVKW